MSKSLRVLQIEDSADDAALVLRHLEQAGYEIHVLRAQEANEMRAALAGRTWDVIIADHHLPKFDAPAALDVLQQTGLDIPFIVVSGTIGEDLAVGLMKSGAHDYLLKSNLTRLAAAVEREVRDAQVRRERKAEEESSAARRKIDEEALRRSNARLITVLESITDGYFMMSPDWRITYVNPQAERLLRQAREDVRDGAFWQDFLEPAFQRMLGHAVETKAAVHLEAYSTLFAAWFEVHAYPSAEGLSVYFRDITERRNAEEKIKRSLKEKEVLLREIHHRVKNNLQIVSSMLRLQGRLIKDENMLQILKKCGDRIQVMSLLHEQLHSSSDITSINLAQYLRAVAAKVFSSYSVRSSKIELDVEAADVQVAMETASACGLIVQELVSNALQHAFPHGTGTVSLRLNAQPHGGFEIIVRDDGKGFPDEQPSGAPPSLGLRLVYLWASQLEAAIERSTKAGTEYRILVSGIAAPAV